ncbi:MAG: ABC transporter permease [Deltaproteobacteria bacterium]|nr:ABC transporter permease [Deltaproteobacteria bacterium]MBW2015936.1 ABC transporter permease [Deltaproteobacteria bacterium]MBW2127950.1 ABC transporter permease [Deltaproteobacteria bacterium]MBW2303214.1 ABC transporter permease [Deltaproteobacteria bacterium]
MGAENIGVWFLAGYYTLLIIPLGVMLWFRVPIIGKTLSAVLRMTLQLLFVGLYLQVVFRLNNPWLNSLWLLVMVGVADVSIARGCGLRLGRFVIPLFGALVAGTAVPLIAFVGPLLKRPNLMDAQYVIPIGGMILGNCLRADMIGIRHFYEAIRKGEKTFLLALSHGARLHEALRPYLRDACRAALLPTVATMATIGLVALPGMMTGVILGGANPMTAIKYQIGIMIAIFTGTAITVILAILMSVKVSFTPYGTLDPGAFRKRP